MNNTESKALQACRLMIEYSNLNLFEVEMTETMRRYNEIMELAEQAVQEFEESKS